MDVPVRRVATHPIDASGRRVERFAAVVAVLLALAVIKPWGATIDLTRAGDGAARAGQANARPGEPRAGASRFGGGASALPTPTLRPDEIECHGPWQLVLLSRMADWNTREWLPLAPQGASGPADPVLVPVVLADGSVRAIGACAAGQATAGTGSEAVVIRRAWRLSPNGPVALPLVLVTDATRGPVISRLYRPQAAPRDGGWPDGRFVLELGGGPASDSVEASPWVAIQVGGAS